MYFAYLELLNFFPPPPADVDCVNTWLHSYNFQGY